MAQIAPGCEVVDEDSLGGGAEEEIFYYFYVHQFEDCFDLLQMSLVLEVYTWKGNVPQKRT